jgi:hypothetical protein
MRALAFVLLFSSAAQANWRPNGGLSGAVSPHLSLPVTSMSDRRFGPGLGFHTDLSIFSAKARQSLGLRLSVDGFSGDETEGGDLLSMDLLARAAVEIDLTRRWALESWGGLGWNRSDTFGDPVHGLVVAGGVSVQRLARLRHLLLGWRVSARWLGAASALVLQTGPVFRGQK